MKERAALIDSFLRRCGWGEAERRPLPGDASFRRYVRLYRTDGRRAMLMDAPPQRESVTPFATVARHLRNLGFSAPEIMAEDERSGFLLLEDLGDDTFTRVLASGGDEAALYRLAIDVLSELHRNPLSSDIALPPYDDVRFLDEAALFVDWYIPAVRGAPVGGDEREEFLALWRRALAMAREVPETLVLRDYHVDNLMLLPARPGIAACGLLDFQDAVVGPASYDVMSLVEDARRDIPPALAAAVTERYLGAHASVDAAAFRRSIAVLGAQRHAKVIGIFTRLDRRDGKPHYLQHIPRLWQMFERDLLVPDLEDLRRWLDRAVPPDRRVVPDGSGPNR